MWKKKLNLTTEFLKKNRGVILIILLAIITIMGIFLFLNISKTKNIEFMANDSLKRIETTYHDFEKSTSLALSGAVAILARDKRLGAIFLEKDRDKLYHYSLPIYKELKNKRILTHWYFLNPEPVRTCFLREHNKGLYGDIITRVTYDKCVKYKRTTHGKELGKTAFALRVVYPWYRNDKLIGYLETAIEINAFFENLKKTTGAEIALIIDKKFLDKKKWESVKREKEEKNNWDDDDKYLLVSRTSVEKRLINLRDIPEIFPSARKLLTMIKDGGKKYIRGVFPLTDASGKKVGGIFILKDITKIYNTMVSQTHFIVILSTIFLGIMTILMIFFHKQAEMKLRKYRYHLEELVEEKTKELTNELKENELLQKRELEAIKLAENASKMASVGVITAGITHEINQPLNAIKVSSDSILFWNRQQEGRLPDIIVSQLKNISKGIDRITAIISHMRNFWNIKRSVKVPITNLNVAVDGAVSLLNHQLKEEKTELLFRKDNSPVYVRGEVLHFEQIMINLISNAIKAQSENIDKPKFINITTKISNNEAILKIHDNGKGLPDDLDQEELFDPFYTTRDSGRGMGLGLSIIKHFVKMYKGTIEASNHKDGGAEFTLKFKAEGGQL